MSKKNRNATTIHDNSFGLSSQYAINLIDAQNSINQGKSGNFSSISSFALGMLTDAGYAAARSSRIESLLSRPTTVEFVDGTESDPDVIEAKESFEKFLSKMLKKDSLESFVSWFYDVGNSIASIDANIDIAEKVKYPTLNSLSSYNLKWDINTEKYEFSAKDTTYINIEPGDGCWVVLNNWTYGKPCGIASQCLESWKKKEFYEQNLAEYINVQAFPVVVYNKKTLTQDNNQDEYDYQLANRTMEGRGTRVIICHGEDSVSSLNTSNGFDDQFQKHIDDCRKLFQLAWLGGNLSQEISSGGSRAAAEVHSSRLNDIIASDAEKIQNVLNEQFFKWFFIWNHPDIPEKNWPKFKWIVKQPEDVEAFAGGINQFASFLSSMSSNTQFEVANIVDIAKKFGIELTKKESNTNG